MGTQGVMCRLCLKICDGFKALEGNLKDVLEKLLPKTELAAIPRSAICTNCAEVLRKCYNFKVMCINAHNNIIPLVNRKGSVKMNLIDVPLSNSANSTGIQEDKDVCGFCIRSAKDCRVSRVERRANDTVKMEKMVQHCLPELDLSTIKKPAICASCDESLEIYFRFIKNCLIVEEKIKKYCESLDLHSTDQIELSSLLQFIIDVPIEVDGDSADIIKIEEPFGEERENVNYGAIGKGHAIFKMEQISGDDSESVKEKVVHKNERYMDIADLIFKNEEQFMPNKMLSCKEGTNNLDLIKMEETFCGGDKIKEEILVEMEDQKCLTNEDIEIKSDESDSYRLEDDVLSHSEVVTGVHRRRKRLVLHKDPLGEAMYRCDFCSFQSKYKTNLKHHLLVHKDPSEVTMLKCASCSFQTKYKASLLYHVLKHKDTSKVTMYKCDSCSFQTKRKDCLKTHLVKHKNPSEVTMYKCDSCSFQARNKYSIKSHSLKHKSPSEVTMHKCDSCSFQTKYRFSLKQHLLQHKNPSKIEMYKCDSCPFQKASTGDLIQHSLAHTDPSEMIAHKCNSCQFRAKLKNNLNHLLMNKDP